MKHKKLKETLWQTLLPFVFGREDILEVLVISFLLRGNILITESNGVGEKNFCKEWCRIFGWSFSSFQCTSETTLESLVGESLSSGKKKQLQQGPIFSSVIFLSDINKLPPSVLQSLFRTIEEKKVVINGKEYPLPRFQNLVATESCSITSGLDPLPFAYLEFFISTLPFAFPDFDLQKSFILSGEIEFSQDTKKNDKQISTNEFDDISYAIKKIHFPDEIIAHLIKFIEWTRVDNDFKKGVSVQGMIVLSQVLRAKAFLEGKKEVSIEDGVDILKPFLLHYLTLSDYRKNESDFFEKVVVTRYKKGDIWKDFFDKV